LARQANRLFEMKDGLIDEIAK